MNTKNTQKLKEDFPEIFEDLHGFECQDGWYDLIYTLCASIIQYCSFTNSPIPIASQVKEKFGGLRFYVGSATEEIFDLIIKAENKSYKTCEVCGEPGKTRGKAWVKTLCEDCV